MGNAVVDPRFPILQDQLLDGLHSSLHDLYKFCEFRNIVTTTGFCDASLSVQKMLKVLQLLPEILKYLHER